MGWLVVGPVVALDDLSLDSSLEEAPVVLGLVELLSSLLLLRVRVALLLILCNPMVPFDPVFLCMSCDSMLPGTVTALELLALPVLLRLHTRLCSVCSLLSTGIRVSDFPVVCGTRLSTGPTMCLSNVLVFLMIPDPPFGIGLSTSGDLISVQCPAHIPKTVRTSVAIGSVRNVFRVLNNVFTISMVRNVMYGPRLTACREIPGERTRPLTRRHMTTNISILILHYRLPDF